MKNKFALCFRPVVIDSKEPDPDDHHHNNHVIISDVEVSKNIIVATAQKKNGMSTSSLEGNISGSIQVPCFPLPKKHSRKTLSRVIRTILYETSQRLRVQNGKIHQLTFPEKTDDHVEESNCTLEKVDDDKQVKLEKMREANISEENNIISSISSAASSSSSTVSSSSDQTSKDLRSLSVKRSLPRSRSNSFDQKKRAKTTETNTNKTSDFSSSSSSKVKDSYFYWIVLALLATTLWGKVFAMILASFWLYFIPRRSSGMEQRLPENKAVKLPEIETSKCREYKKFIMEGLLERKPLQQKALNF